MIGDYYHNFILPLIHLRFIKIT